MAELRGRAVLIKRVKSLGTAYLYHIEHFPADPVQAVADGLDDKDEFSTSELLPEYVVLSTVDLVKSLGGLAASYYNDKPIETLIFPAEQDGTWTTNDLGGRRDERMPEDVLEIHRALLLDEGYELVTTRKP